MNKTAESYGDYLKRRRNPYIHDIYGIESDYDKYKGLISIMKFTGRNSMTIDSILCEIACFAKDAGLDASVDMEGTFSLFNQCDISVGIDEEEDNKPYVFIDSLKSRHIPGRELYVLLEDGATYNALRKLEALIAAYRGDWGGKIRIDGKS